MTSRAEKKAEQRKEFAHKRVTSSRADIRGEYEYLRGCANVALTVYTITNNLELLLTVAHTYQLGLTPLRKAGLPGVELAKLTTLYKSAGMPADLK